MKVQVSSLKRAATGLVGLTVASGIAAAQEPTKLPGIIIESATLERPRIARPAPDQEQQNPAPSRKQAAPATKQPPAIGPSAAPAAIGDSVAAAAGPASAAGIPIAQIGTAVTVVTGDDIRNAQVRHVAEALRALPGVQVSGSGSVGSLTQIRIRGAEGKHTRVVIDGIEANTTKDGEFDFSNLSAEDIERIEIVRGPMSGIYGAGALGGVVNIITKAPKGPLGLTLRTEAGSFGTRDVAARLAGGNDNGYIALSGQWRDIKGFNIAPEGNEKDGTRLGSFAFRAGGKITPDADIDVVFRQSNKRAAFDEFGTVPKPRLTADDAADVLKETSTLAGVRMRWETLDGKLSHEFKASHASSEAVNRFLPFTGFGAGFINNTRDQGERNTFGYSATYRLDTPAIAGKHAFTGRVEQETEKFTPSSDFGFFDGDGIERKRSRVSYAGEWRGTFADRLTLTAGARHDDNDTFQDFTTWRASASLVLRAFGLRPHASVGTGVKLPGMYDQFGPNSTDYKSNPNLKPETSFGWDAGIEATILQGRAVVDVTYFHANLENKIGLDFANYPFSPINLAGTSTREGVEVAARYLLTPTTSLGLAYTYTDARDPKGDPELRRAPHAGRADVTSTFLDGKARVTLGTSYNGRKPDAAFDPFFTRSTVTLNNYWLASAAISYKLQPNVEIFGRVENIFDVKYQEVYGYNTAGLAAYGGVRITFDDIAGVKKPVQ